MLNLNRLRMLREIANHGTIAAAAAALLMSPSAVSQQMAVLEREAGALLLEREGRGVRLTDAGISLVANTERILAEMERAEAGLATHARGIGGRVRVSAFPTAARAILVPALATLPEGHPNLHLSMVDLEPEEAMPALKAREIDIALAYEWNLLPSLEDPGIEREKLLSENVYVMLPQDHPLAARESAIAIAELAHDNWIVGRDATSLLDIVTAAALHAGFKPRADIYSMDFNVIIAAVGAGLGVALGPALALTPTPPGIAIRKIADRQLTRLTWTNIRRGSGGAPGISVVLQALRVAAEQAESALRESTAQIG